MGKNSNIKAVIFDMDGTLTDTERLLQIAWGEAITKLGYPLEPGQTLLLRSLARPLQKQMFCEWYGEGFPYMELRKVRDEIYEGLLEEHGLVPKPGAAELLQWLAENGYKAALATASASEKAERYLELTGIRKFFTNVTCFDMVKNGKPAPDTYLAACKMLGVSPDEAVAVEDSPNGIRSAYSAGCRVIMVPDMTPPDSEIRPMLYACVDSLSDIIGLLG
jgi:DNA helicase-2/ATP-dependent DNA helicase PcrA